MNAPLPANTINWHPVQHPNDTFGEPLPDLALWRSALANPPADGYVDRPNVLNYRVSQTIVNVDKPTFRQLIDIAPNPTSVRHGDAKAAARQIKASGVKVTLNIVGFMLTGKAAEAELSTFARSTGGHYYGAQDGKQLSRAVMMAALQRLHCDVVDGSGTVVASDETSELSRELPPGSYRVRIEAMGQELEAPFTVVPDQTTTLGLGVEGDRFVIRH